VIRCAVCERPCEREVEPAVGECPAVLEDDVWTVALRNGLRVDACHACWFKWPDEHKLFPAFGFGRGGGRSRVHIVFDDRGEVVEFELAPPHPDGPQSSPIPIDDLVALLRETAA
jgi:hypothetical protein